MAMTAHKQRKSQRRRKAMKRLHGEAQHSQRKHEKQQEARKAEAEEVSKETEGKLSRAMRRLLGLGRKGRGSATQVALRHQSKRRKHLLSQDPATLSRGELAEARRITGKLNPWGD